MSELTIRPTKKKDYPDICALLRDDQLPVLGVEAQLEHFVIMDKEGLATGVAGLEMYSQCALLRSVATHRDFRSTGTATGLCHHLMARARESGVNAVYLLTMRAMNFFQRLGFTEIDRHEAPAPIQITEEFTNLCPDLAICMKKSL